MSTRKTFYLTLALLLSIACAAFAAPKYAKVASFKDIGQSRAFFVALKNPVPPDQLESHLWEIVDYHMNKYGQAPQMWIFFFDEKKNAPKDFPIEGEGLEHLIARYFYATDTRKKDLQILESEDLAELRMEGAIESPLWHGQ
jgi:hypothetical protein